MQNNLGELFSMLVLSAFAAIYWSPTALRYVQWRASARARYLTIMNAERIRARALAHAEEQEAIREFYAR